MNVYLIQLPITGKILTCFTFHRAALSYACFFWLEAVWIWKAATLECFLACQSSSTSSGSSTFGSADGQASRSEKDPVGRACTRIIKNIKLFSFVNLLKHDLKYNCIGQIWSKVVRRTILWSARKNSGLYGPRLEKVWDTLIYVFKQTVSFSDRNVTYGKSPELVLWNTKP